MIWIILIAALFGALILYVLNLDFEIGTGFSEEKKKAREAEYTISKKEENSPTKLLK